MRKLLDERWIPSGGERERDGIGGAVSVDDVEPEDERNVQARFFYGDALDVVGLGGSGEIEERADATFCCEFAVIVASRAGAGGSAGRVLHQLAVLLFQRHLLEKSLHALLDLRVVGPRGGGLG